MRRVLLSLGLAVLLSAPAGVGFADDPDPCTFMAVQTAMPSMQQSFAFTPGGYGPAGYGPLTYPFGVGPTPYAQSAYFGPPGVAPSFGPLGPGLTANAIVSGAVVPGGLALQSPANVETLISLAALQQAELNQLNVRYSNAAYYQTAAATWAGGYATQAGTIFTRAKSECQAQQSAS